MTTPEATASLMAAMAQYNLHPPSIKWDTGKPQRFDSPLGKKGNRDAWYTVFSDAPEAGRFGDWKQGLDTNWVHKSSSEAAVKLNTPERKAAWKAKEKKRDEERERKAKSAATKCQRRWDNAPLAGLDHPYLVKKGITDAAGLRQDRKSLLVPLKSLKTGELVSIQTITEDGDKRFAANSRVSGARTTIGEGAFKRTNVIYVTEGWATGWTINQVTGDAVIVAFFAANLITIAKEMRAKYPSAQIIIAADNDRWTKTSTMQNPGVTFAKQAADASLSELAVPDYIALDTKPTDFNDLWVLEGNDAVKEWLDPGKEAQTSVAEATEAPAVDEAEGVQFEHETWLDSCPFRCLGHDRQTYYYLPRGTGQIHGLGPAQHRRESLLTLAPMSWWEHHFSSRQGADWAVAADALYRASERSGVFRPERLRGRGCWPDAKGIILHLGDRLLAPDSNRYIDPERFSCSKNLIYERQQRIDGPSADRAATLEEAMRVLDLFRDLLWHESASGVLAAGWTALAPICGALKWRPHIWITGGTGSGKAGPHSSRVLTERGWMRMGDIRPGTIVTTPDGKCATVLDVYPQGEQDVYELTFGDGRMARATLDHLWKVRCRRGKDRHWEWRLRRTVDVIEALDRGDTRPAIPMPEPLEIDRDRLAELPLDPYVLGVFLGDGGLSSSGVNLTSYDPEIVARVRARLPEGTSLSDHADPHRFGLCGLRFDLAEVGRSQRNVIKELRQLGFQSETGVRSEGKWIPPAYLSASIQDRIELLRGLMDTDGTVGRIGTISYCTTSPQLKDDVVELVRSLGGAAKASPRSPSFTGPDGKKKRGLRAYVINIRLRDPASAFSLPRKRERTPDDYQYEDRFYSRVISIEKVEREECSCITIDHPDQLYVTDDFVVTHNSTVLRELILPLLGGTHDDGGMNRYYEGGTTEAGVRQQLRADALPVLFDEAEKTDQRSDQRLQSVLALARSASSSHGAHTAKGTTHGTAMTFQVRSMFCLASIGGAVRQEADKTRISLLQLRSNDSVGSAERRSHWDLYAPRLKAVTELQGRELMARTIGWLRDGRLQDTLAIFCGAASVILGDTRAGDQYGTLYAGAWMLMSDEPPDKQEAREVLGAEGLDDYIAEQVPEGRRALLILLQHRERLETTKGPRTMAVGQLVEIAAGEVGEVSQEEARAFLKQAGLKVDLYSGQNTLLVATASEWVKKVLRDTPYADSIHIALRTLRGVTPGGKIRFHPGLVSHTTRVPFSALED